MNHNRERAHTERISERCTFQPLDWSPLEIFLDIEAQSVFFKGFERSFFIADNGPKFAVDSVATD
jgi:hypothetical protein